MHRDVTEVHRLKNQAINQKSMLEAVVDVSPSVTVLINDQGEIILDNLAYKALGRLTGLIKHRRDRQFSQILAAILALIK